MIVIGFRAALDLDTYPFSNKPELIMNISFSLVFTPYLPNAVVLAKSPRQFSCPCSTEAVGIAHKPPRSLYCESSS